MGNGAAWGGHLTCNEDIRWVRIPHSPPFLHKNALRTGDPSGESVGVRLEDS